MSNPSEMPCSTSYLHRANPCQHLLTALEHVSSEGLSTAAWTKSEAYDSIVATLQDFLAVPGQPSKSTYSSKAQVAAALGWGSSRRSEKKSAAKAASAATEVWIPASTDNPEAYSLGMPCTPLLAVPECVQVAL